MDNKEWEKDILDKIDHCESLTSGQRLDLVYNYEIDRESISEHRWGETMESIIELGGRLFSIVWFKGATENQDNVYDSDPTEVEEYTETVTMEVTKYRAKGK
ncbi:MAG: hypothetical protein ACRDDH_11795 [Cetobacterium sp.]|uniref:hypothetical protein n=1 Tax=Cetobacterium sp. TaxID=2071632 RepID=UPI003EE79071